MKKLRSKVYVLALIFFTTVFITACGDKTSGQTVSVENISLPIATEIPTEESFIVEDLSTTDSTVQEGTTELETTSTVSENEIAESTVSSDTIPESSVSDNDITESTEEIESNPEPIGYVYLTFDDGPSVEITNQILDILEEKNVKATFFIVDFDENGEKADIIRREINDGHTIGIHGKSHSYASIYTSLDVLIENFDSLDLKLYNLTGYDSNIIRFPGGSSNKVSIQYCSGIMTQATQYYNSLGIRYFDWNVDSDDAGSARSAETIYNNVTTALVPGRNNVVLMHDSSSKQYTLEALPLIIDYCIENGYELRAIDDDTPAVTHHVNN